MRVKIILFVSICSMISFVFTSDLGAEVYDDFNGSEINPDLWYTDNNASGLLYQSGGFLIAESPHIHRLAALILKSYFMVISK
jgi:hypothetical protein